MSISYNIVNVFEAKYRSRKDTVDKKLSLFNNLVMSGNYNFARDSLQWSDVVISGNTNVLKGLTNLQLNALFTPYEINFKTKRRIDQKLIDRSTNKKLLQLVSFNAGLNTSLSFSQIKGLFKGNSTSETAAEEVKKEKQQIQRALPSLASLFDNLRFSHALTMNTEKTAAGRDSFFIGAHSLYISGSIPLSKNWNFNIGSISYDFVAKALVYPSFSFSRDLHCWNMNFAWYPDNGVYSFFIGVKSGSLNFLKYDYTQPYIPRF
ncbi:MAG: hypothetical protein IPN29_11350 [Saprospiraceae bacterium]|nr:hypothetical protein [Saprospiraceae bacterium]